MKKYDVKEELTKPIVTEEEVENETVEETNNEDEDVPKKENQKTNVLTDLNRLKPADLDITFIVIGMVITIAIPLAAVLVFDLTTTGVVLLIVCVGLLDALCFLAHRLMNKKIEV